MQCWSLSFGIVRASQARDQSIWSRDMAWLHHQDYWGWLSSRLWVIETITGVHTRVRRVWRIILWNYEATVRDVSCYLHWYHRYGRFNQISIHFRDPWTNSRLFHEVLGVMASGQRHHLVLLVWSLIRRLLVRLVHQQVPLTRQEAHVDLIDRLDVKTWRFRYWQDGGDPNKRWTR